MCFDTQYAADIPHPDWMDGLFPMDTTPDHDDPFTERMGAWRKPDSHPARRKASKARKPR